MSPNSSLLAFNPNGSSNTLLTTSMSRIPTSYNNDFSTTNPTGNEFTDFNNSLDTNPAMLSTSPSVTTGVWGNGLSLNPNLEFTDLSSANAANTQNVGLLDTLSNSHLLQQQQSQTNSLAAPSVDMLLPQSLIDSADLVRYFNDSTNYSINPNQFFQDLNLLQETSSLNSMPVVSLNQPIHHSPLTNQVNLQPAVTASSTGNATTNSGGNNSSSFFLDINQPKSSFSNFSPNSQQHNYSSSINGLIDSPPRNSVNSNEEDNSFSPKKLLGFGKSNNMLDIFTNIKNDNSHSNKNNTDHHSPSINSTHNRLLSLSSLNDKNKEDKNSASKFFGFLNKHTSNNSVGSKEIDEPFQPSSLTSNTLSPQFEYANNPIDLASISRARTSSFGSSIWNNNSNNNNSINNANNDTSNPSPAGLGSGSSII
ncbi:unnamed protein product [[Candida] boidinii]|nr:unnamed protein product [[Candida] boidinii]